MNRYILILLMLVCVGIFSEVYADWSEGIYIGASDWFENPKIQARNDTVYVTSGDAFYRSLDGGQTWHLEHVFENSHFSRHAEFKLTGDTLVLFRVWYELEMYISLDFGENWLGPRSCGWYQNDVDFFSPNYLDQTVTVSNIHHYSDNNCQLTLKHSYDFGLTWNYPETVYTYANSAIPYFYYLFNRPYILSEVYHNTYSTSVSLIFYNDYNWTQRILFEGRGTTINQSLAAGGDGRIVAIYEDWNANNAEDCRVITRYSPDYGELWEPQVDLSEGEFNHNPNIAMAGSLVVAIWEGKTENTPWSRKVYCKRSLNYGQSWDSLEILTPDGIDEGLPDLTINNGKIYVVYMRGDPISIWCRVWEPPVSVDQVQIPDKISSLYAYPNPFNANTTIRYTLAKHSHVAIDIYDLLGRKVTSLVDELQTAGEHQATWNAEGVSSGLYFYRIQSDDYVEMRKLVLLK